MRCLTMVILYQDIKSSRPPPYVNGSRGSPTEGDEQRRQGSWASDQNTLIEKICGESVPCLTDKDNIPLCDKRLFQQFVLVLFDEGTRNIRWVWAIITQQTRDIGGEAKYCNPKFRRKRGQIAHSGIVGDC